LLAGKVLRNKSRERRRTDRPPGLEPRGGHGRL